MSETGTKNLKITKKQFLLLKAEYHKAEKEGLDRDAIISIDGNEFVMGFLKYMLEFLEESFKK
jgi:hypothetical protein